MLETCKVEIHKQTRLFDDFFKVDEILVAHEQRDGTVSSDQRRLVFERGDAVAALLYEPDTHTVIIVDQFRVPTFADQHDAVLPTPVARCSNFQGGEELNPPGCYNG